MMLVAIVALTGFGIPLALSVQTRYLDDALLRLAADASSAAVAVPGSFATQQDVPELPDPSRDVDVALYDGTGRRVAGEGPQQADALVRSALRTGLSQRNRRTLTVSIPVSNEEVIVGAIRTHLPVSVVETRVRRTWAAMGLLAGAVLGVAGLIALRRSRTLTVPLHQLRDDAALIGAGGDAQVRPPSGIAEIDTVHQALTSAAEELHQLLARERAFSSDLAHQLRTPVAALRLRLETEQLHPDPVGTPIEDALTELDRLERTIDDLTTLARDLGPSAEPHPLRTIISDAGDRWRAPITAAGRSLSVVIEPELPFVRARMEAVRQILDVLLDNALTHGSGQISLSARHVGAGAVVAVGDEGHSVVDPVTVFKRRGASAAGSGIGLALAQRLATAEDLRLLVVSPGPGPTFHLIFGGPRSQSSG